MYPIPGPSFYCSVDGAHNLVIPYNPERNEMNDLDLRVLVTFSTKQIALP